MPILPRDETRRSSKMTLDQLGFAALTLILLGFICTLSGIIGRSNRILLTIAGYAGMGLMALGTWLVSMMAVGLIREPDNYWTNPPNMEWVGVILLGIAAAEFIGMIFAVIGGSIARPRFMWIPMIAIGGWYCLSAMTSAIYPIYKRSALGLKSGSGGGADPAVGGIIWMIIALIPGIVLIFEALAIRKPREEKTEMPSTKSQTISGEQS